MRCSPFSRACRRTVVGGLLLLAFPVLPAARAGGVDLNGNGMSDVWEAVFQVQGLDPNADNSGTGMTNAQKSLAGLNPLDARSFLRVTSTTLNPDGGTTLRWPSVAGKGYGVQVCTDLAAGTWQALGGALAGNGGELVATFGPPTGGATAARFFRVTVADLDSDADGVTDWEELQLGYDPNSRFTPGHGTDANNQPLDDLTSIRAALQATGNTVSFAATDPYIAMDGSGADTGTITVTRTGRLDAMTVQYTVGGTAVAGTDYQALTGTVALPVGVNKATVTVRPVAGATAGPTAKTVVLNLAAGPGYTLAAGANGGTVTLGAKPLDGQVLQEVWTGLTGYRLADVPVGSPPTTSRVLTSLDMPQSVPDASNFGTRIRGYLVPPVSGNHTFWIACDDGGEFWLSTDDQPANKTRRAWVNNWTGYRQWNKPVSATDPTPAEPNQKSALLALNAGQRYYFEILQREGTGGDHVAVGWLKPGQTGAVPSEVVPGTTTVNAATVNVLLPYTPPVSTADGSTLFLATLTPQGVAQSTGSGTATLRLSADEKFAVLSLAYGNLTSPVNGAHLHGPADAGQSGGILFDIDTAPRQSDGSMVWSIGPVGVNGAADVVAAIKSGRTYVNVHTSNYPNGEIRGQFGRTAGATGNFSPPPDPPAWTDDHADANAASRFLIQSTFGPSPETIAQVQRDGYAAFLDAQLAAPPTFGLPHLDAYEVANPGMTYTNQTRVAWWTAAVTGPDQLRQRVAFALSEILVVSEQGIDDAFGLSAYYDTLIANSFGNFRQLLEAVTLSPVMGDYLNMRGNDKPDPAKGLLPNENYAREILQLFTIGLNRLNPDGTLLLNAAGQPVPTYSQNTIVNLARVFTGWTYAQNGAQSWPYVPRNLRAPMAPVAAHHDTDAKTILDGVVLPAGQSAAQDLKDTLDLIFNHPNTGPFVAKQLIQRLVTGNPSPAYVYRVARAFANNGQGVRGDLRATVRAVLLDYEARNPASPALTGSGSFGHQREPVIRHANLLRAFHGAPVGGGPFYNLGYASDLGQEVLNAPSVFNFFEPGYSQPGPIAAGLLSPEFQITGDTQVIKSANFLRNQIYRTSDANDPNNARRIILNPTADQLTRADSPALLVDSLNTLLMAGQMSADMKTLIVNNVNAVTNSNVDTQRKNRASRAIYLIVTSPEFSVQK